MDADLPFLAPDYPASKLGMICLYQQNEILRYTDRSRYVEGQLPFGPVSKGAVNYAIC
jgi:hypothetical protein